MREGANTRPAHCKWSRPHATQGPAGFHGGLALCRQSHSTAVTVPWLCGPVLPPVCPRAFMVPGLLWERLALLPLCLPPHTHECPAVLGWVLQKQSCNDRACGSWVTD